MVEGTNNKKKKKKKKLLKKLFSFLSRQPLTPPPLNGLSTKKRTFCGFPNTLERNSVKFSTGTTVWGPDPHESRSVWIQILDSDPGSRSWIQILDPDPGSRSVWIQIRIDPDPFRSRSVWIQIRMDPDTYGSRSVWIQIRMDPDPYGYRSWIQIRMLIYEDLIFQWSFH